MAKTPKSDKPAKPNPKVPTREVTGSGGGSSLLGANDGHGDSVNRPAPGQSLPDVDIRGGELLPMMDFVVVNPLAEEGTSGLKRARGILLEETLRELRGRLGVRAYREIYDNCAPVAGGLLLYKLILRQVKQNVVARDTADPECVQWQRFCSECLEDMDHRFDDTLTEAYTSIVYGWAYCEEVYKFRLGPSPGYQLDQEGKPQTDIFGNPLLIPPSKFNDGMLGWKRLPLRAQDTLQEWKFDANGAILGMLQNDPWGGRGAMKYIPIEKALLFRTESIKNNPEGRSLLRSCWPLWRMLKRIMEAEAIGVTRDITGIPKITVPAAALMQNPKPNDAMVRQIAERIGTALAQHEEAMIMIPMLVKDGKQQFDVTLMGSGGTRSWNTGEIIARLEARMLTSIIMQFLLLGQGSTGSWALSDDQSDASIMAINAIAEAVADVFTDVAFPRLVKLNGGDPAKAPIMQPTPAKKMPSLKDMGQFLAGFGRMGLGLIQPGSPLESAILNFAGLPTSIVPGASSFTGQPPKPGGGPGGAPAPTVAAGQKQPGEPEPTEKPAPAEPGAQQPPASKGPAPSEQQGNTPPAPTPPAPRRASSKPSPKGT